MESPKTKRFSQTKDTFGLEAMEIDERKPNPGVAFTTKVENTVFSRDLRTRG